MYLSPTDIPEVGAFQILQSEIVIPEADISAMHVCVELVNGSLWRSVTLTIAAVPGSASCECTSFQQYLFRLN